MQGSCAREDAPWLNRKIRRIPNNRPVRRARSPASQANPGCPGRNKLVSRFSPALPGPFSPPNLVNPALRVLSPVNLHSPVFPGPSNLVSPDNPDPLERFPVNLHNPVSREWFARYLPAPSLPHLLESNPRSRPERPA